MSAGKAVRVPPLNVQLKIADAAVALQHLAMRQALWLQLPQQADPLAEDDLLALVDVGHAIDAQLADVELHADVLRQAFEQYGHWMNEGISAALTSGRFNADDLAAFAKSTGVTDGDYASRGVAIATAVASGAPGVRTQLRDRISGLPAGVILVADGVDIGCGMMAASSMAGLALCPKTLGVGCAVGAAGLIAMVALGC